MADIDLELRILAVLPLARGNWNRGQLLYRLGLASGPGGDPNSPTAQLLTGIADRSVKAPAHERRAALQGVAKMLGPAGVDVYGRASQDRDLFSQMLGIDASCNHDAAGRNSALVEQWTKTRLTNRHKRKEWDFNEMILAIRYFERIDRLDVIAALLVRHDDQLLAIEARVLDDVWPKEERASWASSHTGAPPNLSGLDGMGLPMQVFLEAEAAIKGWRPPAPPKPATPEAAEEFDRELEDDFWKMLQRLERRLALQQ